MTSMGPIFVLSLALAFAAPAVERRDPPSGCQAPRSATHDVSGGAYQLQGTVCSVHDPAIAAERGRLFVFSTDRTPQGSFNGHLLIRCGEADNRTFSVCAQVFSDLPAWSRPLVPEAVNIWAPDISFFNGLWHLYYAISEYGKPVSVIGLATARTLDPNAPDAGWTDRGLVIATNGSQGYNAIDPSIFDDGQGNYFMILGSFWRGLQVLRIDPSTGKRDETFPVTRVATRPDPDALEGSFVQRRGAYFYLFSSWNQCCIGVNSTYEVRIGRSLRPDGPYIDMDGTPLLTGGGTKILGGQYGWAAAGGESLLRDTADGDVTAMVVHAYDGVSGDPWLQLIGLLWRPDGWPIVVPWDH